MCYVTPDERRIINQLGKIWSGIPLNIYSYNNYFKLIIWQGKSEHSDWFFLGRDFAIQTVSVETAISCVFFASESWQI